MQEICTKCGKLLRGAEFSGDLKGICFECREKPQKGVPCKKNCGNDLSLIEQTEGLKGICSECREEIANKKSQIAKKVEKGRSKEVCNVCRACGGQIGSAVQKGVSGKYAHAVVPQTVLKKTDLIILRFLTIIYTSAFEKRLTAETLAIDEKKIISVCEFVEKKICGLEPDSRDGLKDFYQKLITTLEQEIADAICPSVSSSSATSSSSSSDMFCLPPRFNQIANVTELSHISEIIGQSGSLGRFGIGKQCKACEDLQRDDSIVMRHDEYRFKKDLPPTFIGNKCLEMMGTDNVRTFVWKWLRTKTEEEPCVLEDIFYRITKPESAATKVLTKLRRVFECFYSVHLIAMADNFSLVEEDLDKMLAQIEPKLPKPVKEKEDSTDTGGSEYNIFD